MKAETNESYVMDLRDIDQQSFQFSNSVTLLFKNVTKVLQTESTSRFSRFIRRDKNKGNPVMRTLLDNVTGQVRPGEITALMGPSGSGKTTLLNTLAGRNLVGVTGAVYYNGIKYTKSMKRRLAYVLQTDLFFERLTVEEQLTYTALLRLPGDLSKSQKLDQVDKIITALHLDDCRKTQILLISGGEKKRVNIGTELLTDPSVIFLDEPTSGLDSTAATLLMSTLRELSHKGKTIITSIHQPSSHIFLSFDRLILLADGKIIYQDKPTKALEYFAKLEYNAPDHYNPADFIIDLVNSNENMKSHLKEAYEKCQKENGVNSSESAPIVSYVDSTDDDKKKWPVGFLTQFSVLYRRSIKINGKEQFSKLSIIQTLVLGIMCGILWLRMPFDETSIPDRAAYIFFAMTFWPFSTLFHSLMSYPFERTVINKERATGSYRLSAYFLAKTCSEAPMKLVLPTLYLIISYWMANINPYFQYFMGFIVAELLAVLSGESIGLFIGATVQNLKQAFTVATLIMLGLMLLGGFFIKNLPSWLKWAKWLSFFKYSFDACLTLQFSGPHTFTCVNATFISKCTRNDANNSVGSFAPNDVLEYLTPDLDVGENLAIIFAFIVVLRIGTYLALRFINDKSGRL